MNELKAFDIVVAEEYYCEGIVKYRRAVYDKSEADKVIANHKYKRCLAMANYWGLLVACTRREIQLKCMRRELKWHKLAEKFKEAK